MSDPAWLRNQAVVLLMGGGGRAGARRRTHSRRLFNPALLAVGMATRCSSFEKARLVIEMGKCTF